MSNYSELLKDPRWQKKRLLIFERDGWMCQICLDENSTLNVHHNKYIGDKPWETPDEYLLTVCEQCHKKEEELKNFDFYSMVEDLRITRSQIKILLDHVRFRLLHPYRDATGKEFIPFWNFHHDILRNIIPNEDLSDYIEFLGNGKNKIKGSAKIAQPDFEQSEVEKQ
jgi:hypothetical protein